MRRVATAVTYREPRLVRGVLIKVVKMISEEERGSSGYPLRWHPIPCGGPDTVRGMYVLAKAALAAKLGGTTKSSSHGCKTGTGAFLI